MAGSPFPIVTLGVPGGYKTATRSKPDEAAILTTGVNNGFGNLSF